jgi:spermidine synthase
MRRRLAIVLCLVFSGLAALVYQIIWTRLLGLAFGTTTEAISCVLAVFFGGMALGNWLAAGRLARVRRPLRVYAWLELGIGAHALLSLPLLLELDTLHAWMGAERLTTAAALLLPPTLAMGATLPVVARGLVVADATLGRWSAWLYAANTLGAVLGAYLCGFWLIPELGLTRSVLLAAGVNIAVAVAVWAAARGHDRIAGLEAAPAAPGSALTPPERGTSRDGLPALAPEPAARELAAPPGRRTFLVFFGLSGFVAIGYEIVWARVFGIVMEGTLYGFATVLASFLLGLGLGSLVMARRVDRLRDPAMAFGLLHVAIAVAVALGLAVVPLLPYAHASLVGWVDGVDTLHLLFLLAAPIVLVPTALFGAAFPVLIRIYTSRASQVGEGMGRATAVNTAGSIAASLGVGFWALPALGMDATLFALLLLELFVALLVLFGFASSRGRRRLAPVGMTALVLVVLSLSYNGVQIEKAIAGREAPAADLTAYLEILDQRTRSMELVIEGKSAIVTVADTPQARQLGSNGLAESGLRLDPPYYSLETILLGTLPFLMASEPERALVIGLGGGNTLTALRRTPLSQIDVVEIEEGVARAVEALYVGRESPLLDPRVRLRIEDGRHELLLGRQRGGLGYDVIASQPSHPWIQGAANLFTEEYFALARDNLSEGGVFALWLNGFRTDSESVLAVVTSFERVLPGSLLWNGVRHPNRSSLLLLGGRRPLTLDPEAWSERLGEGELTRTLAMFDIHRTEDLLAQLEGPAAAFAAIRPSAANTDDNAFVETRIPRHVDWQELDFSEIERELRPSAPVLPPLTGPVEVEEVARSLIDVAETSGHAGYARKLERLLRAHGDELPEVVEASLRLETRLLTSSDPRAALDELRRLAASHPEPGPYRALGRHLARRERRFDEAAAAFARAHARSGDPRDAYDAGRSRYHVDPEGAWEWFERIPVPERERFPRLTYYAAERALGRQRPRHELVGHLEAVAAFRDTTEGRRYPGTNDLLARLATAIGDAAAATEYADAAYRERSTRAEPWVARASELLAHDELPAAWAAVAQAADLLPGDPRVARIRAEIALRRGEPRSVLAALGDLRGTAPSLGEAIRTENRLRVIHGLPLLPDHGAERLASCGSGSGLSPDPPQLRSAAPRCARLRRLRASF